MIAKIFIMLAQHQQSDALFHICQGLDQPTMALHDDRLGNTILDGPLFCFFKHQAPLLQSQLAAFHIKA